MTNYGIYSNSLEFYNSLIVNNRVKLNLKDGQTVNGTVISLKSLGIKALVVKGDDNKKYILFPNKSEQCEICVQ